MVDAGRKGVNVALAGEGNFGPMSRVLSRSFLFAAFILFSAGAVAGSLKNAFKALEVHNYFLARDIFRKQVKKHPAAAWYGLSVISGRANNPFFDVDSCHAFIVRADAAYSAAPDKERAYIAKEGVDHAAIAEQLARSFELGWEVAKGVNTVAAYDRYLDIYIHSPRTEEAILVRDHLAYQQVRAENTSEAYQRFLRDHPQAKEVYEARNRYNEALYREYTADRQLTSFLGFIEQHPESPYVRQAEDEIFRLETPKRTVAEYRGFIERHPRNHRVNDAWRAIYELHTRDLSTTTITRFLQEFPDYPFVEELVDDYRTASLVLLPFRHDGKWGFIDDKGTERIKAQYEWVEPFEGGQALVGTNGRTGTVNRSGRVVVPIEFDDVSDQSEGTFIVERSGRTGAVDRSGELVVPMVYDDIGEFSSGLAYAEKEGRFGYINARGDEMIPFRFRSAGTFQNGVAVVEVDSGVCAIDMKGNVVVPALYEWIEGFATPVSRMRKGGRMGLVGRFGDVLLPAEYDHVGPFRSGLALVVKEGKCGYADSLGVVRIPLIYDAPVGAASFGDFVNGLAVVARGDKRCLINTRNEVVLPCTYPSLGPATGRLVPFLKKGKWGFAEHDGTVVVTNKYDAAWGMNNGVARVRNAALMGLVDSTGKEILAPRFSEITETTFGTFVVKSEEGVGSIDAQGKVLVQPVYSAVAAFNDSIVKLERGDRFGYFVPEAQRFLWKEDGFDTPLSP